MPARLSVCASYSFHNFLTALTLICTPAESFTIMIAIGFLCVPCLCPFALALTPGCAWSEQQSHRQRQIIAQPPACVHEHQHHQQHQRAVMVIVAAVFWLEGVIVIGAAFAPYGRAWGAFFK